MNRKYAIKFLYKILLTRGFDDPNLIQKWETFHPQANGFFPVRIHKVSQTHSILYIKPQTKMAGVTFGFIKTELLYALHLQGYAHIKEVALAK